MWLGMPACVSLVPLCVATHLTSATILTYPLAKKLPDVKSEVANCGITSSTCALNLRKKALGACRKYRDGTYLGVDCCLQVKMAINHTFMLKKGLLLYTLLERKVCSKRGRRKEETVKRRRTVKKYKLFRICSVGSTADGDSCLLRIMADWLTRVRSGSNLPSLFLYSGHSPAGSKKKSKYFKAQKHFSREIFFVGQNS